MLFMLFFSFDFNPLSPCRERRVFFVIIAPSGPFQSTLPMRGETMRSYLAFRLPCYFNPLSPCGERRKWLWHKNHERNYFNPLSPCGERLIRSPFTSTVANFNPLSPCGERQDIPAQGRSEGNFNPLSPCGERPSSADCRSTTSVFQSTLPMRGETWRTRNLQKRQ